MHIYQLFTASRTLFPPLAFMIDHAPTLTMRTFLDLGKRVGQLEYLVEREPAQIPGGRTYPGVFWVNL